MPNPEFITWLAYFKIKNDEAKEAHLEAESGKARAAARGMKRR